MVFLYSFLTIRINQTSMTFLRKNLFVICYFFDINPFFLTPHPFSYLSEIRK